MGHFAQINHEGEVLRVIVAEQEAIDTGDFGDPKTWIKTSYNTRANVHHGQDGKPDGGVALRAHFAGPGMHYDSANDVFIHPQPYPDWTMNTHTWHWESPVPYPDTTDHLTWSSNTKSWIPGDPHNYKKPTY